MLKSLTVAVTAWALLSLGSLPAWALDPDRALGELILESWGSRDGLPQNSINGLLQASDAYLWMATFDGLVRFDGVQFERMPDEGLPSRRLSLVGEEADGFWIAGEHGGLSWHDGRRPQPLDTVALDIPGVITQVMREPRGLWVSSHEGLFLVGGAPATAASGSPPSRASCAWTPTGSSPIRCRRPCTSSGCWWTAWSGRWPSPWCCRPTVAASRFTTRA